MKAKQHSLWSGSEAHLHPIGWRVSSFSLGGGGAASHRVEAKQLPFGRRGAASLRAEGSSFPLGGGEQLPIGRRGQLRCEVAPLPQLPLPCRLYRSVVFQIG